MSTDLAPARTVADRLLERNRICEAFFAEESVRLARACHEMAERFLKGGRILAFGRGPCATDAQHVSVEFVHPVIVGKRALPALDLSAGFESWVGAMVGEPDMVMGFAPPGGDPAVDAVLAEARRTGAMTFAFPGDERSSYGLRLDVSDPFVHQEVVEILYHTLWESVHVFFEHKEKGRDVGAAGFLYPFLGSSNASARGTNGSAPELVQDVAASIRMKADDDAELRARVADEQADAIHAATAAIHVRLRDGGKLLVLGNGGSATDANDFVIDCVAPPRGYRKIPAVSFAMEPAIITAIANDVGTEVVFVRQLIAHAGPKDVVVAISTSGGSANVIAALAEARKRGLTTVALLGYDGGEMKRRGLADHFVVVPSDYIPRIQEVQASVYHVIREMPGGDAAVANVELFGTRGCPYTGDMREWLEVRGIDFREYDVDADPQARERLRALTGGQRTVPVLVEDGRVLQVGWQGRGCAV